MKLREILFLLSLVYLMTFAEQSLALKISSKDAGAKLVPVRLLELNKDFSNKKQDKKYSFKSCIQVSPEEDYVKLRYFYKKEDEPLLEKISWVVGSKTYRPYDLKTLPDQDYAESADPYSFYDDVYNENFSYVKEFYFSKKLLQAKKKHRLELVWSDKAKARIKLSQEQLFVKELPPEPIESEVTASLQAMKSKVEEAEELKDKTPEVLPWTEEQIKEEELKYKESMLMQQQNYFKSMATMMQNSATAGAFNNQQMGNPMMMNQGQMMMNQNPYAMQMMMQNPMMQQQMMNNPMMTQMMMSGQNPFNSGMGSNNNQDENGLFGNMPGMNNPFMMPGVMPALMQQNGGAQQQQQQVPQLDNRIQNIEKKF